MILSTERVSLVPSLVATARSIRGREAISWRMGSGMVDLAIFSWRAGVRGY